MQDGDSRTVQVRRLGMIPYAAAVEMQADLVRRRRAAEIPDQLLLLEHPHVYTMGASARSGHVLLDDAQRRLLGIELVQAGRGGDVTYHGPGQLVGYPIIDLKPDRCDLNRYLRDLENVLVLALADVGISALRRPGFTGVWVADAKVAAIGVHVSSGWITSHGFALNVEPNLDFFRGIIPCGIEQCVVTSVARLTANSVGMSEVVDRVERRFAQVFQRSLTQGEP